MHEPSQTKGRRRIDAHKLLWTIGVLLVAIMAAFQVYDVLRRRAIVVETTERTYASLARSLAEQTQLIMLPVEAALRETASEASLNSPRSMIDFPPSPYTQQREPSTKGGSRIVSHGG
jgi:hypothetical protein